ncbi:Protein CYP-14A3, partial [Aphelenchoides avenae]
MLKVPVALPRENIHLYIREVKKKYGPVFTIFTPLPVVVLSDYESLKEALVTKGEHFIGRVMRPPTSFFSNVPGGGGILANDGDSWRDQRRIALSILRDFGMGRNMMEQKIMHSVAEMCDAIDKTEDKSRVNMYPTLQLCVGNVINELLFGYIYHYDNTEKFLGFCGIINEFFQCFHRPDMLLVEAWSWTKHLPLVRGPYNKTLCDMTAYFDFIIKEVEAQEKTFDPSAPPTSFVHAYMKEIDGNNNDQKSYCRDQLVVLASDFWAAGMETTATSLRWAVMFMMRWTDIQMKVQAEIDRVIGCDRFPTLADKPNLPYTNAVILEVQRYANIVSAPGSHR